MQCTGLFTQSVFNLLSVPTIAVTIHLGLARLDEQWHACCANHDAYARTQEVGRHPQLGSASRPQLIADFPEAWSTLGAAYSRALRTHRLLIWPMLREGCHADEIAALSSSLAANVTQGAGRGGRRTSLHPSTKGSVAYRVDRIFTSDLWG